jgi:hypothetical protein
MTSKALGSTVNKFGHAPVMGNAGVSTHIWDGGSSVADYAWAGPADGAAEKFNLTSTSGDDDGNPVGAGAHVVQVFGLDANWALQDELVTLEGASAASTANDYLRIFRMRVTQAATGATNVGIISATGADSSNVIARILAGQGQTQMAIYTVPAGKHGHMWGYYASVNRSSGASARVDITLFVREDASNALSPTVVKHTQSISETGTSAFQYNFGPHYIIGEKSDIILSAVSSANASDVSGGFNLELMDNG